MKDKIRPTRIFIKNGKKYIKIGNKFYNLSSKKNIHGIYKGKKVKRSKEQDELRKYFGKKLIDYVSKRQKSNRVRGKIQDRKVSNEIDSLKKQVNLLLIEKTHLQDKIERDKESLNKLETKKNTNKQTIKALEAKDDKSTKLANLVLRQNDIIKDIEKRVDDIENLKKLLIQPKKKEPKKREPRIESEEEKIEYESEPNRSRRLLEESAKEQDTIIRKNRLNRVKKEIAMKMKEDKEKSESYKSFKEDEEKSESYKSFEELTPGNESAEGQREDEDEDDEEEEDESLTDGEIDSIMKGFPYFYGALAFKYQLDEALDQIKQNINFSNWHSLIYRIDNEEYLHWVSLFFDLQAGYVGYYNSFGLDAPSDVKQKIIQLLEDCELPYMLKWKYNKIKIQPDESELCGLYCVKQLTNLYFGMNWKEATGYQNDDIDKELEKSELIFGFV